MDRYAAWLTLFIFCGLCIHLCVLKDTKPSNYTTVLGTYIKNIHYGGMDGIVTTFAVVSGVEGANMSPRVTLVLGFASLFADALSMGVGEYVSATAELEYEEANPVDCVSYNREEKVLLTLEKNGYTSLEANHLVSILRNNTDIFNYTTTRGESTERSVGWAPTPLRKGVITFCSFLIFGSVPLVAYIGRMDKIDHEKKSHNFIIAIGMTSIGLFALGVCKSIFIDHNVWWWAGLVVVFYGEFTAGTAYGIGWLIEKLIAGNNDENEIEEVQDHHIITPRGNLISERSQQQLDQIASKILSEKID